MTTSERTYLLDVNVLVALTHPGHVHHEAAHAWRSGLPGSDRLATTPVTEAGLVRLMLNPKVAGRELGGASVLGLLQVLRSRAEHRFMADDSSLAEARISVSAVAASHQVTDLHLVNLAASHDAVLATFDARLVRSLRPEDRRYTHLIPVT